MQMLRGDTVKPRRSDPRARPALRGRSCERLFDLLQPSQGYRASIQFRDRQTRSRSGNLAEKMRAMTGYREQILWDIDSAPSTRYSGALRRCEQGKLGLGLEAESQPGRRSAPHHGILGEELRERRRQSCRACREAVTGEIKRDRYLCLIYYLYITIWIGCVESRLRQTTKPARLRPLHWVLILWIIAINSLYYFQFWAQLEPKVRALLRLWPF